MSLETEIVYATRPNTDKPDRGHRVSAVLVVEAGRDYPSTELMSLDAGNAIGAEETAKREMLELLKAKLLGYASQVEGNMLGLNKYVDLCHAASCDGGWWHDKEGNKLDRNPGEMIALIHSEASEMMEGARKDIMDDHLPHRKMEEVEAADLFIRLADYCGGRGLDLESAVREKLAYNAQRADHKREARDAEGGKKR